jgi:hypothetical protein
MLFTFFSIYSLPVFFLPGRAYGIAKGKRAREQQQQKKN